MAAHIANCKLQNLLKPCVLFRRLPDVSVGNKKVSCVLFLSASLHTQRRIGVQAPKFAHHLLRCRSQLPLRASILSARWNSSSSTAESTGFINPPTDYIPPAPPIPETGSATADIVESLNALGEPTIQSLGLGSMWPSGLYQQLLEFVHCTTGMPWWSSIVLLTVGIRFCMFPLVIKSQKASIGMANHMPTIQRLQTRFTQARQRGNVMEAAQYGGEMADYMKRNDVNPFKQMLVPMAQVPVFVSVFVGLRGMANLPVESMKTGGAFWFPDLTVPEGLIGLPLMTMATFWATIEVGADGVNTQTSGHIAKWFLRALPVLTLPFIMKFPTAMLVYWFTSNSFSLVQVLFLKIPAVRTFFKIPERVKHPHEKTMKKGFVEGFKESYSNMKASQKMMERQRLDETRYRKAAQGPIVKTYSYNPKKVKSTSKENVIAAKSKNP